MDSNLANWEATVEVESILELFSNNSMVFEASQGSVETLFRSQATWKKFTSFCSKFI